MLALAIKLPSLPRAGVVGVTTPAGLLRTVDLLSFLDTETKKGCHKNGERRYIPSGILLESGFFGKMNRKLL